MEWICDEFVLTDDTTRVDLAKIQSLLQGTYWGIRRPPAVVSMMIEHSLPFTLRHQGMQIGFGRVVSDYTVFSWVADIVIDTPYRGKGLGQWMMSCIVAHPKIRHTQMVLQTRDAHSFYERFGFSQNATLMSTKVEDL